MSQQRKGGLSLLWYDRDKCLKDILLRHPTQGIPNGVTMVFMTAGAFLGDIFASESPEDDFGETPGFRNTFVPSAGTDGVRVIIHDPGEYHL